jgi:hypothetical protein
MSHDDFDFEPIRGLPALLPPGETLLWQGEPDWKSLAIRAYHVRKVAVYFALLVLWRIAVGIGNSQSATAILLSCAFLVALGGIAIGVLTLLAYMSARATVYSITSRRVIIRHGVAVPMTLNLPFKRIEAVGLGRFRDGTGDIALTVAASDRVGLVVTWPHVRPRRYARPEPSLRALKGAVRAAEILAAALAADAGCDPAPMMSSKPPSPELASGEPARPAAIRPRAAATAGIA